MHKPEDYDYFHILQTTWNKTFISKPFKLASLKHENLPKIIHFLLLKIYITKFYTKGTSLPNQHESKQLGISPQRVVFHQIQISLNTANYLCENTVFSASSTILTFLRNGGSKCAQAERTESGPWKDEI